MSLYWTVLEIFFLYIYGPEILLSNIILSYFSISFSNNVIYLFTKNVRLDLDGLARLD